MKKEKQEYNDQREHTHVNVVPFGGKIFSPSTFAVHEPDREYTNLWLDNIDKVPPHEGKYLQTVCTPVLCLPSIWQPHLRSNKYTMWPAENEFTASIAPFPKSQELKFEGNERVASSAHNRRFLPIPRDPCNDTVAWNLRPALRPHDLDALRENRQYTEEDMFFDELEVGLPNDEDLQVGLSTAAGIKEDKLDKMTLDTDRGKKKTNNNLSGQEGSASDEEDNMDAYDDDDPYKGIKADRLLGHELLDAIDPKHVYF